MLRWTLEFDAQMRIDMRQPIQLLLLIGLVNAQSRPELYPWNPVALDSGFDAVRATCALTAVRSRIERGLQLSIVAIGGSNTMGVSKDTRYSKLIAEALHFEGVKSDVKVLNKGAHGVGACQFAPVFNHGLLQEIESFHADILIIETSPNDEVSTWIGRTPSSEKEKAEKEHQLHTVKCVESLVRTVLEVLPNIAILFLELPHVMDFQHMRKASNSWPVTRWCSDVQQSEGGAWPISHGGAGIHATVSCSYGSTFQLSLSDSIFKQIDIDASSAGKSWLADIVYMHFLRNESRLFFHDTHHVGQAGHYAASRLLARAIVGDSSIAKIQCQRPRLPEHPLSTTLEALRNKFSSILLLKHPQIATRSLVKAEICGREAKCFHGNDKSIIDSGKCDTTSEGGGWYTPIPYEDKSARTTHPMAPRHRGLYFCGTSALNGTVLQVKLSPGSLVLLKNEKARKPSRMCRVSVTYVHSYERFCPISVRVVADCCDDRHNQGWSRLKNQWAKRISVVETETAAVLPCAAAISSNILFAPLIEDQSMTQVLILRIAVFVVTT